MLIPVLEHEKADGHWPSAEKIARIESDKVHVQVYPMKYEEMQALGNYMLDTRPRSERRTSEEAEKGGGAEQADRQWQRCRQKCARPLVPGGIVFIPLEQSKWSKSAKGEEMATVFGRANAAKHYLREQATHFRG